MAQFPSAEWCRRLLELFNSDPEAWAAGQGWDRSLCAICDPEPPHVPQAFIAYAEPIHGRLDGLRILSSPELLEQLAPDFLARASYSVWKGLLNGSIDPVEAVLQRRLTLLGDLQPIAERLRYKGIAARVIAQLSTQFPDEVT